MLNLKVGRHSYKITELDRFMDNGSCVQLISQSKENPVYGSRQNPVLSKRAILEISKFTHNQIVHGYSNCVKIFSLSNK